MGPQAIIHLTTAAATLLAPGHDVGRARDAALEQLLEHGRVVSTKDIGHGVTRPKKIVVERAALRLSISPKAQIATESGSLTGRASSLIRSGIVRFAKVNNTASSRSSSWLAVALIPSWVLGGDAMSDAATEAFPRATAERST